MPIEWLEPIRRKDGNGYMKSKCGLYSVVRERGLHGLRYGAWSLKEPQRCLGWRPTLEEAKALCA